MKAKIECPGSFPPTMPCRSKVSVIEEVLGHVPGSPRGEEGGRQADGDKENRGTTQEPGAALSRTFTPDNEGDLGGRDTAQP